MLTTSVSIRHKRRTASCFLSLLVVVMLFPGVSIVSATGTVAADLKLQLPSGNHTWTTEQLLAHPQAQTITIPNDVTYRRAMQYRAVPMATLLPEVAFEDHLQALSLDGFASELPASLLLQKDGSQAWLAVENPEKPWPRRRDGSTAGPFYLVWVQPAISHIGPEQWPFQITAFRLLEPPSKRFSSLAPQKDADTDVRAGFLVFQKFCLSCHRLNGQGDAEFGPDLNWPANPIEYYAPGYLRRYLRDPQSLRQWPQARMRGFSAQELGDDALDQLLAYLRYMAGHKEKPAAAAAP